MTRESSIINKSRPRRHATYIVILRTIPISTHWSIPMSTLLSKATFDQEEGTKNGEELAQQSHDGARIAANVTQGSLFPNLPTDLVLHVCQFIGNKDLKSYIHLATCCDPYLERFVYRECAAFLWTHIDLALLPGITDTQLESLFRRIDAQSVTKSILLDKSPRTPITGVGLEPLRNSRVLESIDLRQSNTVQHGPTGLDDELVADILITMIPHNLRKVKIRKVFVPGDGVGPFAEYPVAWHPVLLHLRLKNALTCTDKACSHCGSFLVKDQSLYHLPPFEVLKEDEARCDKCKGYTCGPWNSQSSNCPSTVECDYCLDMCCPCRPVRFCGYCITSSCSDCKKVLQCSQCLEAACHECSGSEIQTCKQCLETFCFECRDMWSCDHCESFACLDCNDIQICEICDQTVCNDCERSDKKGAARISCHECHSGLCHECVFDCGIDIITCSFCNLKCELECNPEFLHVHSCIQPGE